MPDARGLTVLLPVHNEGAIVERAVGDMLRATERLGVPFEVLVCENGSADDSRAILERMAARDPRIHVESLPVGDYGGALRHGIRAARFDDIVIFNVDYWSAEFLDTAWRGLADSDMVIGSKVMGRDRRPAVRRLITRAFNLFLRVSFGFRGTDTHGMKAFKRETAGMLAGECLSKGWIFDTELVLRAERHGLAIVEKPVDTIEIRPPSYGSIVARVPETLRNIAIMRRGLGGVPRRAPRPVVQSS
jgi:glycosyltransferase involved in cell wall biosynthesis